MQQPTLMAFRECEWHFDEWEPRADRLAHRCHVLNERLRLCRASRVTERLLFALEAAVERRLLCDALDALRESDVRGERLMLLLQLLQLLHVITDLRHTLCLVALLVAVAHACEQQGQQRVGSHTKRARGGGGVHARCNHLAPAG